MEFITHLPQFRVVVCRECRYAVLPSSIDAHFARLRPHGFTKQARARISAAVADIGSLILNQDELSALEFPFPAASANPIAELAAPEPNGFRCLAEAEGGDACLYIGRSTRRMREHCGEKHGWKSRNKGGYHKAAVIGDVQEVPWRSGVYYQRFFKQGSNSRYFEVSAGIQEEYPSASGQSSTWEIFQAKAGDKYRRVEEAEQHRIKAADELREPNPWLRRTGWTRHLHGLDAVKLRNLIRPAEENEEALQQIHCAFERLIYSAQAVAVTDVIGQPALFEAHRKESCKKPGKPFNSRMDKTTFRQYTNIGKQLLSYIWRANNLEGDETPGFRMSRIQQLHFDNLVDEINAITQPHNSSDTANEEAKVRLQSVVLELWIALLDHKLGDHQYQSIIISGLAVLGLQNGGGWTDAEDFTPKLSAVIKLARLMVVRKAYELRQQSINRRKDCGSSQDKAEEEAPSHFRLVQLMTQKFMMLVDSGGEPSPMDWMLDTRTYGMYIRYHTPAEGTISWKGDTILYQTMQFDMQQVRSMVYGLLSETTRILMTDLLLLELDEHGNVQGEQLPAIDWANSVDNPTESKTGWSFLDDIRNKFETKVTGRDWLAKRVIESPELSREFVQGTGPNGILWRRSRIEKYYRKVDLFQEQLLILVHLTGGQAARAPEIISIRHRNTANGGIRNIFLDGGLVLFVTAYHKGYEYSEKTKLIQRFMPREVGELYVYYVWLALRFFETMQLVVDGVDELSAFVWGDGRSDSRYEDTINLNPVGDDQEGNLENYGKLPAVNLRVRS